MTTTKVIGACIISGKHYMLYVAATDGTAIECTIRDISGNLKNMRDILAGQRLESFWLTIGTPSDLDLIQFKDDAGGIIYEWGGCIDAALGQNPDTIVDDINCPITPGSAFEVTTSD